MPDTSNSLSGSLIPPQPLPAGAQDLSKRVHGLMDGQAKNDAVVERALEGLDTTLDVIAARLYSLASMLVGEGEDGVRLVETAVATAEVATYSDVIQTRKNSRRALARAALGMLEKRTPGCLDAPEGLEPCGGCLDDDDLKAAGVSLDELELAIEGPDRDRVRTWLEELPADVRTVFVLRAVAGFTAAETAGLLVEHGGVKAAGWNVELVRAVFRQGLCSLGSQVLQAGKR